MIPRAFIDPYKSRLPALERSILKLRGMQMLLVMFYAEELKAHVLSLIRATDRFRNAVNEAGENINRIPNGQRNPVGKALNILVKDNAITTEEKDEIEKLIDYRNDIAHRLHQLLSDINADRNMRLFSSSFKEYDYNAVERFKYFQKRLSGLYKTHHYVVEVNFHGLMFRPAEKTFEAEIKKLSRKITDLSRQRREEIKRVNAELLLKGSEFENYEMWPGHPLNRYDDGRLTRRGVEICFRLFDSGKSEMAVAHLMETSLRAIKRRQKEWEAIGGVERPKLDISAIPHRKFYRRADD